MPQVKRCSYAKATFVSYFRAIATRVGIRWDESYESEIERGVDEIFAEAVIVSKREVIEQLENEGRLVRR